MSPDSFLHTTRSRRRALALLGGAVLAMRAARAVLADHDGT